MQQGKRSNVSIKGFTKRQHTFEESLQDLSMAVNKINTALVHGEADAKHVRLAASASNLSFFSEINPLFTPYIVEKVRAIAKQATVALEKNESLGALVGCDCSEPARFAIPCVHQLVHLLQAI